MRKLFLIIILGIVLAAGVIAIQPSVTPYDVVNTTNREDSVFNGDYPFDLVDLQVTAIRVPNNDGDYLKQRYDVYIEVLALDGSNVYAGYPIIMERDMNIHISEVSSGTYPYHSKKAYMEGRMYVTGSRGKLTLKAKSGTGDTGTIIFSVGRREDKIEYKVHLGDS